MRAFYVDVIGLIESDRGRGTTAPHENIFLSMDPTKHHQLVLASGRPVDAQPSMVNQLSFKLASLDELREMYRWVKQQGVTRLYAVSHGNAWSIYFWDPEESRVELYLDTPWYVAQPHSDPLDLEKTNDEILRRTEEQCRSDQSFMPVAAWQEKMQRSLQQ
jgi:catechol 2,3-dioxygenase